MGQKDHFRGVGCTAALSSAFRSGITATRKRARLHHHQHPDAAQQDRHGDRAEAPVMGGPSPRATTPGQHEGCHRHLADHEHDRDRRQVGRAAHPEERDVGGQVVAARSDGHERSRSERPSHFAVGRPRAAQGCRRRGPDRRADRSPTRPRTPMASGTNPSRPTTAGENSVQEGRRRHRRPRPAGRSRRAGRPRCDATAPAGRRPPWPWSRGNCRCRRRRTPPRQCRGRPAGRPPPRRSSARQPAGRGMAGP